MEEYIEGYLFELKNSVEANNNPNEIEADLRHATDMVDVDQLPVPERVQIAKYALDTPFRFFRYAANLLHPTECSFA